jgi:transposase InsO family protein
MSERFLHLVVDNWPKFLSKEAEQWAVRIHINFRFIDTGKPMQNAYDEKFRDEWMSQHCSSAWKRHAA